MKAVPKDAINNEKIKKFYLGSKFFNLNFMLISSKITNGINGNVKIPGDKSISHRSIIIPSIQMERLKYLIFCGLKIY